MQAPAKPASLVTWIVLIVAIVLTGAIAWKRGERVEFISSLANVETHRPANDDTVEHRLIIPGHTNESFQWILETETLFRDHRWRLQTTTQDNAPYGRSVRSPAPYRWWLAAVTWAKHLGSTKPLIDNVETAALWADPVLLILWLVLGTLVTRRFFGDRAGMLFAVGTALAFPSSAAFLPAAPDHHGLAWILAAASVASLAMGYSHSLETVDASVSKKRLQSWFIVSGMLGAIGLWVDVSIEVPLLLAIVVSAFVAAILARKKISSHLPWLTWSTAGALASVVFYLVENAPGRVMQSELRVLHPLYAIAWLGLGFLIDRGAGVLSGSRPRFKIWDGVASGVAIAAIALFPVVVYKTKSSAFWAPDLLESRLTKLSSDGGVTGLWDWLIRAGVSGKFFGTIALPISALIAASWAFAKKETTQRVAGALISGPLLIAVVYGCSKLSWWNVAGMLGVLMYVAICGRPRAGNVERNSEKARWAWAGLAFCALLPALSVVVGPLLHAAPDAGLEDADLKSLIERDLAHYLQAHADSPHAIVMAPPSESVAFYYYGGLRGLGSLFWENVDGVGAAVRIASASTAEEAEALIDRRGVNDIVIPTWDEGMDQYARVGSGQLEGTFLDSLHHWNLPNWVRPIAYSLPTVNGFENQFVSVFKIEDQQNDALALGRLADYFIDIGKPELSVSVAQNLRKFPADFGAIVTRAEIALTTNDQASLAPLMQAITSRLTHGGDRFLAFDRRVDLAVLLARTQQTAAAKDQVEKCLAKIDAAKIRSLSVGSLYRLQVLEKVFGLRISEPELYRLARDLLTPDLREKL